MYFGIKVFDADEDQVYRDLIGLNRDMGNPYAKIEGDAHSMTSLVAQQGNDVFIEMLGRNGGEHEIIEWLEDLGYSTSIEY
jgi:hypothetical protein